MNEDSEDSTDRRPVGVALAAVTWTLPAQAAHWLTDDELTTVTTWMHDNDMDRATADRPVIVAAGRITYSQDRSGSHVLPPDRHIVERVVPLRTAPPDVRQPTCTPTELATVQDILQRHVWSSGSDGVCVTCSTTSIVNGQVYAHRDDVQPWPCPPVEDALTDAGLPVPGAGSASGPRLLADCLSPDDQARVFGPSW